MAPANAAKYHRFFNGFGRNVSPFQVPHPKELDERWEDLFNFSGQDAPHVTEAISGDEEHYVVELNVFHQIHCLNRIRTTMYSNHYPDMHISLPGSEVHVSHCLGSTRQSLMCSSDVSLIVWQWDAEAGQPFPRGDVVHRCRGLDRIRKWAVPRQLDDKLDTEIRVVDDLPSPPLFY